MTTSFKCKWARAVPVGEKEGDWSVQHVERLEREEHVEEIAWRAEVDARGSM